VQVAQQEALAVRQEAESVRQAAPSQE